MIAQRITSPFATPERSADVLGVPKTRAKRLIKLARSSAGRVSPATNGTSAPPSNEKVAFKKAGK
jgi:hypothetical protein